LFSVRGPWCFGSHATSLLAVACGAAPARSGVTFRLTEGESVSCITPRDVSLGRLCLFLLSPCDYERIKAGES